jgi:hypothetical protein
MVIPLGYDTHGGRKIAISVLPFLPLGFVFLQIPWAYFCFIAEAGNMGDDNGMTPAVHAEMRLVGTLLFVPVFLGLVAGVFALIRSRRYGCIARTCAVLGTAVCAVPFVVLLWVALFHH